MAFSIKGKTALVTGANRGLGEAIVEALILAGAKRVYATARNPYDRVPLERRDSDRIVGMRLDVTDPARIRAAAAAALDVQLLVNNAGVAAYSGGIFIDPKWLIAARKEMEVNFFGTFAMTQAFSSILARNGGGAVVNIASVTALVNFPLVAAYSASKAATHSLTQATRAMLKGQGTQVFGVYPGPINTRMVAGLPVAKTSPASAAAEIVAGIETGQEEIFPDPVSRALGAGYLVDPKSLERRVLNAA